MLLFSCCFYISCSDVRCWNISRKKGLGQKFGSLVLPPLCLYVTKTKIDRSDYSYQMKFFLRRTYS